MLIEVYKNTYNYVLSVFKEIMPQYAKEMENTLLIDDFRMNEKTIYAFQLNITDEDLTELFAMMQEMDEKKDDSHADKEVYEEYYDFFLFISEHFSDRKPNIDFSTYRSADEKSILQIWGIDVNNAPYNQSKTEKENQNTITTKLPFALTANGRIKKYLEAKTASKFTPFDKILDIYISGKMREELLKRGFRDIETFVYIHKIGIILDLSFAYQNLSINLCFDDEGYEYEITALDKDYDIEDIPDELPEEKYEEFFFFSEILNKIAIELKSHPELRDFSEILKKQEKYKKIYRYCYVFGAANLALLLLLGPVFKVQLPNTPLIMLPMLASLIAASIFEKKSKKNK